MTTWLRSESYKNHNLIQKALCTMTNNDLIVDFPHQRSNHRVAAVQFADTAQMYTVERHEDYGNMNNGVARHELWYTKAEYYSMKLAIREDVGEVRAQALAGGPFNYAGNDEDDASAEESSASVCCIGIEHLLTPACMLKVKTCRARCTRAVLVEQSRQGASEMDVALASFSQTRKSVLRGRKLGKLLSL
ncbi:hypothetical protein QTG54_003295 [Skeletonema marinoi]|uniref:Uncharacterized protein n=1 Tax=Skeletonema marinoi TaxID=267567 RepID=A0AAD8YF55_9STRA|nr:hypothetical protein QTG54_003295 [Skeletonema marinoi]